MGKKQKRAFPPSIRSSRRLLGLPPEFSSLPDVRPRKHPRSLRVAAPSSPRMLPPPLPSIPVDWMDDNALIFDDEEEELNPHAYHPPSSIVSSSSSSSSSSSMGAFVEFGEGVDEREKVRRFLSHDPVPLPPRSLRNPLHLMQDAIFHQVRSAFANRFSLYRLFVNDFHRSLPIFSFLYMMKPYVQEIMLERLRNFGDQKFQLRLRLFYSDPGEEKEKFYPTIYLQSGLESLPSPFMFDFLYARMVSRLLEWTENYFDGIVDYSFTFEGLEGFQLATATYDPYRIGTYLPLPDCVSNKHSILNPKVFDNCCFVWALVAAWARKQDPSNNTLHRFSSLDRFFWECPFHFEGLKFPFTFGQLSLFHKNNPDCHVNLFFLDMENHIVPFPGNENHPNEYNLFFWTQESNQTSDPSSFVSHMGAITNLNRLMSRDHHRSHRARLFCRKCLSSFEFQHTLEKHILSPCGETRISFPKNPFLSFRHQLFSIPRGWVVYADFESMLVPTGEIDKTHRHEPIAFMLYLSCWGKESRNRTFFYVGKECMVQFWKALKEIETYIFSLPSLRTNQEWAFINSMKREGERLPHRIPLILHNFKGYDSHFLLSSLQLNPYKKIQVIAINQERFISLRLGPFQFLDSFLFLPASLETLASDLAKSSPDLSAFHCLNDFLHSCSSPFVVSQKLLTRKGIFPYEYLDSLSKLNDEVLPPMSSFYSSLTKKNISLEDFQHAQNVWSTFGCSSLQDYLLLYLKTDVFLLADVFSNFREKTLAQFRIDPVYCFSSPHLSFQAMLRQTGVTISLFSHPDFYQFLHPAVRGGISMIVKRFAEVSPLNKNCILYFDANNLYGWAMSQPLPTGDFEFLPHPEEWTTQQICSIPFDSSTGYIFEVDLDYPVSIQPDHADYPFFPEKMVIPDEFLSPYSQKLKTSLGIPSDVSPKLISSFLPKKNYVVHYRYLQLGLRLGVRLVRVHRVLSFSQCPWMKPYIEFCSKKRKEATTPFDKMFYKLMVNSIYGKTLEDKEKRREVKIALNEKTARNYMRQPTLAHWKIISENAVLFQFKSHHITLDKPMYLGFSVLDLSKFLMANYYYYLFRPLFGNKMNLLMTDTDSFLFEFLMPLNEVEALLKEWSFSFDFSSYPPSHPLYSLENQMKIGKLKVEIPPPKQITGFVGLRSKMYAIRIEPDNETKSVGKGVHYHVLKKISFQDYKDCLFNQIESSFEMSSIQSKNQQLYTISRQKKALSPFDNKRYFVDEIHSIPYGTNMQSSFQL